MVRDTHLAQRRGVGDLLSLNDVVAARRHIDDGRHEVGHGTIQTVECKVVEQGCRNLHDGFVVRNVEPGQGDSIGDDPSLNHVGILVGRVEGRRVGRRRVLTEGP